MTARRFIPALADRELAFAVGALAPPEREAMAEIAETADLLTVAGRSWLLVPASPFLLDTLAAFGAEAEDRENDIEDEPETDREPDDDREPDQPAIRRAFAKRRPRRLNLTNRVARRSDGTLWRQLPLS